jgi:protein-S-isoprenylcysteine O-methyltransferase Ste14
MTMGTGVVLFVIGAILAFAVHVQTAFISLSTVGDILMAAGIVVFVIGLALAVRGRRTVTTARTDVADPAAPRTVRRTTRSSDPGDV